MYLLPWYAHSGPWGPPIHTSRNNCTLLTKSIKTFWADTWLSQLCKLCKFILHSSKIHSVKTRKSKCVKKQVEGCGVHISPMRVQCNPCANPPTRNFPNLHPKNRDNHCPGQRGTATAHFSILKWENGGEMKK